MSERLHISRGQMPTGAQAWDGPDSLAPSGEVAASPGQLPIDQADALPLLSRVFPWYSGGVPFWSPAIRHTLAALGWRWLIMGPCVFFLILPLIGTLVLPFAGVAIFSLWVSQIWVGALGVVISLMVWAHRRAVRGRTSPFCIHCGYDLDNPARQGRCPECGRPFVFGIWDEYRKDPAFFRRRVAALRELPRLTSLDTRACAPLADRAPAGEAGA